MMGPTRCSFKANQGVVFATNVRKEQDQVFIQGCSPPKGFACP